MMPNTTERVRDRRILLAYYSRAGVAACLAL
jgi:hypothetical protein